MREQALHVPGAMQCAAVRTISRAISVPVQELPCEPTMVTTALATVGEGALPPPTMADAGCAEIRTVAATAK
jgi:hypothetical protein